MTVALDDGAGVRTEAVTDADGVVVFEVDWSLGPVDVVIDGGNYLRSLSGVQEGTEEIKLHHPFLDLEVHTYEWQGETRPISVIV